MSDEPISNRPADMTSTDTDNSETENASPQIFDITPDLNIAPAKDEPEPAIPATDGIATLTIGETKPEPQAETKVSQMEPSFGPANPPAKTVGVISIATKNLQAEQNIPKPSPSSLQEAISTIKLEQNPTTIAPISKPIPERPWQSKAESIIKPLRTYETDFAEAMAKNKISKASFVIAEDKKKNIDNREPIETKDNREDLLRNVKMSDGAPRSNGHATRNWILGLISLILICGGAYAGYYLYLKSPIAPSTNIVSNNLDNSVQFANSLIRTDQKAILNIDNKNKNGIIALIKSEASKPQDPQTIKEIVLSKTYPSGAMRVPSNEMLNITEIPAPDLFNRSLSSPWMLGIYSGQNNIKHPFVITTNNFFQNTFAGLIQWEKTLPEDLRQYTLTSNVTDDGEIVGTRGQYKDKIIKNKDVREYIAENGHIIFLYSFISNDRLIITNSEEALEEIITRLEKDAFIR